MTELTLTKEQKSAISSLKRAFTKCKKANVYFHNCYGRLIAYDGNIVERVDNGAEGIDTTENDGLMDCHEGELLIIPYDLDSYADDNHYVHLKEE